MPSQILALNLQMSLGPETLHNKVLPCISKCRNELKWNAILLSVLLHINVNKIYFPIPIIKLNNLQHSAPQQPKTLSMLYLSPKCQHENHHCTHSRYILFTPTLYLAPTVGKEEERAPGLLRFLLGLMVESIRLEPKQQQENLDSPQSHAKGCPLCRKLRLPLADPGWNRRSQSQRWHSGISQFVRWFEKQASIKKWSRCVVLERFQHNSRR